jgi:flagellar M-ring protein FliF
MFLNIAKVLGGVTVLLVLVLSVLRPMIRSLVGPQRQQVQLMPRTANAGPAPDEPAGGAAGANTPALPGADGKAIALTHEQQVAQARTLANQDAKRVAQVVRGWVAQDE